MSQDTDTIARYERFRQADPGNAELRLALGDLYHRAGRLDEALATFREGLAVNERVTALRSREASVLISLHRFAEAEASLRPLVQADPGNASLQHNLGLTLYHQHQFEAAREAFDAARANGGTEVEPETWAHLAYSSHQVGDMAQARSAATRWAELAPSGRAEGYLSLVELDCLDYAGAYQRARETLKTAPDNVDANVVSGVEALELQEMERADAHYTRASTLEPDNPRAWVGVALVRLYREEHARAIEAFERALALAPRDTGTLVALGWTHFALKDYPAAEAVFRRAVALERNFGEAHGGLASALVMQNRRDEARATIAVARRLAPTGFGHIYAKAVLLGLEGKQELGAKLVDRAIEQPSRPGLPSLLDQARVFMSRRQLPLPPHVAELFKPRGIPAPGLKDDSTRP